MKMYQLFFKKKTSDSTHLCCSNWRIL